MSELRCVLFAVVAYTSYLRVCKHHAAHPPTLTRSLVKSWIITHCVQKADACASSDWVRRWLVGCHHRTTTRASTCVICTDRDVAKKSTVDVRAARRGFLRRVINNCAPDAYLITILQIPHSTIFVDLSIKVVYSISYAYAIRIIRHNSICIFIHSTMWSFAQSVRDIIIIIKSFTRRLKCSLHHPQPHRHLDRHHHQHQHQHRRFHWIADKDTFDVVQWNGLRQMPAKCCWSCGSFCLASEWLRVRTRNDMSGWCTKLRSTFVASRWVRMLWIRSALRSIELWACVRSVRDQHAGNMEIKTSGERNYWHAQFQFHPHRSGAEPHLRLLASVHTPHGRRSPIVFILFIINIHVRSYYTHCYSDNCRPRMSTEFSTY